MKKSVSRYLAEIGSKGGQTTGPTKARSSEVARAAALKRWGKVAKEVHVEPAEDEFAAALRRQGV